MKIIIIALFLLPLISSAQNVTEYKATNKITYKVGDTVKLGKGSAPNGDFQFIKVGGFNAVIGRGHSMPIRSNMANKALIIKSIKAEKANGTEQTYFVTGSGITTLNLYIDAAIRVCEVIPCDTNTASVADELTKLKKLLDNGGLTQAEYDAQKKKLLNP